MTASFSLFGHPKQVNANWSHFVFLSTGARAGLHRNGFLANCVQLASTYESVWSPIAGLRSQVGISKLAMTCNFVWPGL